MIRVNESAAAYDIAQLLRGETGIFEATSPKGEVFQIISRAGQSITNFRPLNHGKEEQGQSQNWRVRKIGELGTEQETQ